MPTLELTDQQVVELVKQLPAEQKRTALLALANDSAARRDERMEIAQVQIRRICSERGSDQFDSDRAPCISGPPCARALFAIDQETAIFPHGTPSLHE